MPMHDRHWVQKPGTRRPTPVAKSPMLDGPLRTPQNKLLQIISWKAQSASGS